MWIWLIESIQNSPSIYLRPSEHVLRARNGESHSSTQNMQVTFQLIFSTKFTGKIISILSMRCRSNLNLFLVQNLLGKSKYIEILFQKRYWKNGDIFSKIRFLHDIILSYMWENLILNQMKLKRLTDVALFSGYLDARWCASILNNNK